MNIERFEISRRSFVKQCAITAAAAGLPLWFIERELAQAAPAPKRLSANDRPGIALIGCGGMGRGDAGNAARFGEVLAVCDVDGTRATEAVKQFTKAGKAPTLYDDFRKVMERDDIHVVINATPDHWHTLVSLAAVKAGKDVYGEKPLTLTLDEGKRLVRAVRQHKTVFQTGSQQRSDKRFRLVCELVRNGRLGKLKEVTVWLPAGLHGGPFPATPVPQGLNWDYYLGQAPKVDYLPQRCHTTFRYWFDYSGGVMTDWGAHHNDIVLWAIGQPGPVSVEGKVLTEPVPGGYTAFSEFEVLFTYANGVRHKVRTTTDDSIYGSIVKADGQRNGLRFEGTNGWIWITRGELLASDESLLKEPLPEKAERLYASNDHMGNLFDCIRSRKPPICEAAVGHRSVSDCHLGVIALRLGRKLSWNPSRELFVGDHAREANAWQIRPMRKPYDYSFI